ncbi:MAG: hypothetical protein ACJAYG_001454 [Oceanicoccus sp.]|jgi:hypothetical protein
MSDLLVILGVLFISLFVVVKFAEKFAKPVDPAQLTKMSRIAMILIAVLLVGRLLQQMFAG